MAGKPSRILSSFDFDSKFDSDSDPGSDSDFDSDSDSDFDGFDILGELV
jgi:hypothetical protein